MDTNKKKVRVYIYLSPEEVEQLKEQVGNRPLSAALREWLKAWRRVDELQTEVNNLYAALQSVPTALERLQGQIQEIRVTLDHLITAVEESGTAVNQASAKRDNAVAIDPEGLSQTIDSLFSFGTAKKTDSA